MSTRLEQLQKMLQRDPRDSFLLYGIAMEHKKAGDIPAALDSLAKVIEVDSNYAYAFYQRGQILEMAGDHSGASQAYTEGITAATRSGDAHARSELETALQMLES